MKMNDLTGMQEQEADARSVPSSLELRDHANSDHQRGCMGRQYSCTCGYDTATEKLLLAGAARIADLERKVEEMRAQTIAECAKIAESCEYSAETKAATSGMRTYGNKEACRKIAALIRAALSSGGPGE